jgi:hypothetical protein
MTALALLVSLMLEDPVVRQRVQQDPQLRAALEDPAVQRHVGGAGTMEDGMTGLRELVSALLAEPAVQARVQADPALRDLWADPAVRRRIQERGHR